MEKFALALDIFGAVLGTFAAGFYGIRIWLGEERANLATWLIILILDFAGLYLAYATGNDRPYIQIGWCAAAAVIVIATWVRKGDWQWTKNETFVLVICMASVAVWLTSKEATISLLGYLTAAYLAAWPQAKDYVHDPKTARKSAWVWQVSAVAILFPLASKFIEGKYGVGDTLVYYGLLGLNIIMTVLCMRRTK